MRNLLSLVLLAFFCLPRPAPCQRIDSITVYFEFNQAGISPTSDSVLGSYLRGNSGPHAPKRLSLSGYCDNIGSDVYNDSLSMRRALAVKHYLLRNLPASVIGEVHGLGKRQPVNTNASEEQRAMNRRVVVVVEEGLPQKESSARPASADEGPIHTALQDTATRVGTTIILRNVIFYGGRHVPLDSSYAAMDELVQAMRDYPGLVIRIEGHVCCVPDSMDGPDIDTRKPRLSDARARVVYEYLLQHGIDSDRMTYIGLGGANKIYPNERNPTEQALNRRVEVRIIAKPTLPD